MIETTVISLYQSVCADARKSAIASTRQRDNYRQPGGGKLEQQAGLSALIILQTSSCTAYC